MTFGTVLKYGAAALAVGGVGFAIGVSLPEIRRRMREEEEKKKAAEEAEKAKERQQDKVELEQVKEMSPEAQVHYFERRRARDEKKAETEKAAAREKAAREGLGGALMLIGMRFRSLAFLILLGQEIANAMTSTVTWLASVFRRQPGAPPIAAVAA